MIPRAGKAKDGKRPGWFERLRGSSQSKPQHQQQQLAPLPPRPNPSDITSISLEEMCKVCYNLDPSQAPRSGPPVKNGPSSFSWAVREYNLPAGSPVARITIDKSQILLDSAQGCFFCAIISTALSTAQPGWEAEDTVIRINLAPNVPVTVQLQYGQYGTSSDDTLGFEVSTHFEYIIQPGTPKPTTEIETYRPRLCGGSGEAPGRGDLISGLLEPMGFGEEIASHAGDDTCVDFIKKHVENCIKEHNCGGSGGHSALPLLPDRVIWIQGRNTRNIRLVEPKNTRAKYIALSYCWGLVTAYTYLTDQSTVHSRKTAIDYNALPPLLQDVLRIACLLDIEYIWVDRLCIIQGDNSDFKKQAPKMGDIYGNATLTIAAASTSSENDHILVERDAKWKSSGINLTLEGLGTFNLKVRRRSHKLGTEDQGGDYGRVSTRAWIWQERLLSARTVFFTTHALKFECHCHSIWEGFDEGISGNSWSSNLEKVSIDSWLDLVDEFMRRDITYASDRLPAIAAVMNRIEKRKGWTPFWSLWKYAIVGSLGWKVDDDCGIEGSHPCEMNPKTCAPSWSWLSINGPISHGNLTISNKVSREVLKPWIYDLECHGLNDATGSITVDGRFVTGWVEATVKLDKTHKRTPSEPDRFNYQYRAVFTADYVETVVNADVALMPRGDEPWGMFRPAVRVPVGEAPPTQSWIGYCIYLMVATRGPLAIALLLGPSLRNSKLYERIGIAYAVRCNMFEGSKRGRFEIV
ncbi:hypothetical protein TESG_07594 [Trichophyton tonsurans CBS 112818]|uniref:Heterokaryon incompatibility domain-containing protein n=1 Tax=Trichophyton tonsurans (strain CBS 112818) TaxID=647933 RepID=F2S9Q0_TRIT1|nr:hypothetical protein TESG_07594 [Trichophyton tonsurans CBS 112818]